MVIPTKVSVVIFLLLILAVLCCFQFFYRAITPEQYLSVGHGMTRTAVLQRLGTPVEVVTVKFPRGPDGETWYYNIRLSFFRAGINFFPDPNKPEKFIVYNKVWGFKKR